MFCIVTESDCYFVKACDQVRRGTKHIGGRMPELEISQAVGDINDFGIPSPNLFDDVLSVQYLINRAYVARPSPPLPLDGDCSAAVMTAIADFEDAIGQPRDGRIVPGDPTLAALNSTDLSEFEGVTDPMERRAIIQRPHPQWNFTRGNLRTVQGLGGLRFAEDTDWCPDQLKARYLIIFEELLDPDRTPAGTWGVSPVDWWHSHLGLWSGYIEIEISLISRVWLAAVVQLNSDLLTFRAPYLTSGVVPVAGSGAFRTAYLAFVRRPEVWALLQTYASLPESYVVHHTFEPTTLGPQPQLDADDARRHWMVDVAGNVATPLYRAVDEISAAAERGEFYMQGTIELSFLIDKTGTIHMALGDQVNLAGMLGEDYNALRSWT